MFTIINDIENINWHLLVGYASQRLCISDHTKDNKFASSTTYRRYCHVGKFIHENTEIITLYESYLSQWITHSHSIICENLWLKNLLLLGFCDDAHLSGRVYQLLVCNLYFLLKCTNWWRHKYQNSGNPCTNSIKGFAESPLST